MKRALLITGLAISSLFAFGDPPADTNISGKLLQVQKFEKNQPYGASCPGGDIRNVIFVRMLSGTTEYQFWVNESSKTTVSMALAALSSGAMVDIQTDRGTNCAGNWNLTVLNVKK